MKPYLIIFLIILLPLSCRRNSDVLATTSAGEITRLEFNDWLESRNISVESVYKDSIAMSDNLRQLAVEKLTAVKAENIKFNEESLYKNIENTLYKNYLAAFFIEKKNRDLTFNEKGADISIIRLFIKGSNASEQLNDEEHKKRIIYSIIAELKAGKDFNELASKFSEDAASRNKGRMGVIPENILEDEVRKAVSNLKENDYTKEPVIVGKSLCLIKLHKIYDINEKNIRTIVSDKDNAERIIDYYKKMSLDEIIHKVSADENIVSGIDKVSYRNPGEIIFVVEGESFTVKELEEILKMFYTLRHGVPSIDEFSLKEKKMTSEKIFKERIFASVAKKQSLDDDPVFRRNWFYLKRAALAGSFKYNNLIKNLSVSDDEAREDYMQNRTSAYYKLKKINNKEIKVYQPFSEVKTSILKKLNRDRFKALKKQWDCDILSEGNFKVTDQDFLVN